MAEPDDFEGLWLALARDRVLVGLTDERRVVVIGELVAAGLRAGDVAVLLGRARAARARDPAALLAHWLIDPAARWQRELQAARAAARSPGDKPAARYEPIDDDDAQRWRAERAWARLSGDRRTAVEVAIEARMSVEALRELLLRHAAPLGADQQVIDAHMQPDPAGRSRALRRWLADASRRHADGARARSTARGGRSCSAARPLLDPAAAAERQAIATEATT